MAVRPLGLKRVATDMGQALEQKGIRAQRFLRPDVKIAHHIGLALAASAGTGAAQFFQLDEALAAVVPLHREFLANLLNVFGSHAATLGIIRRELNP